MRTPPSHVWSSRASTFEGAHERGRSKPRVGPPPQASPQTLSAEAANGRTAGHCRPDRPRSVGELRVVLVGVGPRRDHGRSDGKEAEGDLAAQHDHVEEIAVCAGRP